MKAYAKKEGYQVYTSELYGIPNILYVSLGPGGGGGSSGKALCAPVATPLAPVAPVSAAPAPNPAAAPAPNPAVAPAAGAVDDSSSPLLSGPTEPRMCIDSRSKWGIGQLGDWKAMLPGTRYVLL